MLLQFTVENFRSFKHPTVLSMEASSDTDFPNHLTTLQNETYLNTVAIFGANAAGKSNLFAALTAAIMVIRRSNIRQVGEPLWEVVPYGFDPQYAEKPTSFEFVFWAEGKKYVYGFSATQKAVETEYLYVYHTAKSSTIFERSKIDHYRFTNPLLKRELLPLTKRNTENKLFLATAASWNSKDARPPYLWFEHRINTFPTDFTQLFAGMAAMFDADTDQSLHRFTQKLLHEADINIDDFSFEAQDITREQFLQQFPPEIKELVSTFPPVNKVAKIQTLHTVTDENGTRQYDLPLDEESHGTQNLFGLSPVLKRAFEKGETVCIDEFDASLHPLLVRYLFSLFNNPDVNRARSQLIISSHSVVLMSLKNLRRDQIYFVEKDQKTGISELYSLDEFSPRKEEDIRKAYMLGRYGSIPDIAEEGSL